LEAEGLKVSRAPYLDCALILDKVDRLSDYESFNKGLYQIMDISSMMVCKLAEIKEGSTVLDICAAPGGKTLHAADILNGSGHIISRDISENKINLIDENLLRNGFENVTTELYSAIELDENMIGKADLVIADLPCSGLGIIGRKSDIKYRIKKEDLQALKDLQREMLKCAVQYVKEDGILMYSTCTIDPLENEENVKYLINELGLEPVNINDLLPKQLKEDIGLYSSDITNYVQLLPGICACDGFFISKFKKGVSIH